MRFIFRQSSVIHSFSTILLSSAIIVRSLFFDDPTIILFFRSLLVSSTLQQSFFLWSISACISNLLFFFFFFFWNKISVIYQWWIMQFMKYINGCFKVSFLFMVFFPMVLCMSFLHISFFRSTDIVQLTWIKDNWWRSIAIFQSICSGDKLLNHIKWRELYQIKIWG